FYGNRGNAWVAKENLPKAVTDYSNAIRLEPKEPGGFCARGEIRRKRCELDLAIADFTEAIKLNPKMKEALYDRGEAWLEKKEYDRAIADLTEAIKIDPTQPFYLA